MPREALIIGLGLIGGSAGLALRRRGWRVAYLDPHVDDPGQAADERVTEVRDAEVVLLATPVDVAVEMLTSGRQAILPVEDGQAGLPVLHRAVTTSTCSVMRPLRAVAGANFVAGHPMAGSEARGLAAATATLFEGKPWFLDGEDARVDALVRDCGARIERVDAAEHDAAVALTSHLPQILSTALAAYLDDRPGVARFAGSGLKTFLRLAGSDASVWRPVLDANRDQIAPQAEAVAAIVREIVEGDPEEAFAKAQHFWRTLV